MSEAPAQAVETGDAESAMPRQFGKYTLLRKFAVGGMAELYLALQRSMAGFEKLLVVKRILPELAKNDAFIEMLLTEARIAATLNHGNVAHTYDVGEVDSEFYIAMEHIHGEDLRAIVRQMKRMEVRSFPLEHAIAIGIGCCAGLAYAHEKRDLDGEPMGIVHRDISPQNVVVTFDGDVKIVDFGIAKARGMQSTGDGERGFLKGKVPYMSPEQARGLELDHRTDIFSLGIILFELCTGRRLFRTKDEVQTLRRIVEGDYPRPRDLNPRLPLRLDAILQRALARDRADRYQSARHMQQELEDFVREEQLKVSPLSQGAWMRRLFADRLEAQKRLLQEGRQMADVLAEEARVRRADDASRGSITLTDTSKVRPLEPREESGGRSLVMLGLAGGLVLLLAAGLLFALLSSSSPPEATLAISSTPPGASIWVDGDLQDETTPAEVSVPLGPYLVRVGKDGYEPTTLRGSLDEAGAEAPLTATLTPEVPDPGILSVTSIPAGAHILLDGRDTELTTPATVADVRPVEAHRLTLTLDGYQTAHQEVSVEAGGVNELTVTLEPAPLGPGESLLRLRTNPASARVNIEGVWHDGGSPYEIRLPARSVSLVIQRDGYRTSEQRVTLPGGEVHEMTVALRRGEDEAEEGEDSPAPTRRSRRGTPGRLTFASSPWCNVTIDGARIGTTPIVEHELSPGNHTVRCENPEVGSTSVTVNIPAGETVRRRVRLP